jgi:hypothetical protein
MIETGKKRKTGDGKIAFLHTSFFSTHCTTPKPKYFDFALDVLLNGDNKDKMKRYRVSIPMTVFLFVAIAKEIGIEAAPVFIADRVMIRVRYDQEMRDRVIPRLEFLDPGQSFVATQFGRRGSESRAECSSGMFYSPGEVMKKFNLPYNSDPKSCLPPCSPIEFFVYVLEELNSVAIEEKDIVLRTVLAEIMYAVTRDEKHWVRISALYNALDHTKEGNMLLRQYLLTDRGKNDPHYKTLKKKILDVE